MSSTNAPALTGNISLDLTGNISVDSAGNYSGTITGLKASADKFINSETITEITNVSGSLGGAASVSGNLSSWNISLADGSYSKVSGVNVDAGTTSIFDALSDPTSMAGNDTITLSLPSVLPSVVNINSGTGNDTINLTGGNGSLNLITGDGNDTVTLGDGKHTVVLGAGADTLYLNGTSGGNVINAGSQSNLVWSGTAASHSITYDAASGAVIIGYADHTTDILTGGEHLTFKDMTLDLTTATGGNGVSGLALAVASSASSLDLSNETINGIPLLSFGTGSGKTLTISQQTLQGGSVIVGGDGIDILALTGTALDLSSAALSAVEVLKVASSKGLLATVAQAELQAGGSVVGGSGIDGLVAAGTELDLSYTTLSSIELLKAGQTVSATVFTVNQADLVSNGSVIGGGGMIDSLVTVGSRLDLSSTSLSGIDVLQSGYSGSTVFTVNQADLVSGGTVLGNGSDTLAAADLQLNLTSTTLSGVAFLQAATGATTPTVFTLNSISSVGEIDGNGSDSLVVASTSLDLSNVNLAGISVVRAGTNGATTIIGAGADGGDGAPRRGLTIIGGSGNDTLTAGIGGDTLMGGGGNDTLNIGDGDPTHMVGSGKAIYFYQASSTSEDTVNGFRHLVDQVQVYSPNFAGLTSGKLSASAFYKGGDGATISGTAGSKVYFIFDTDNNTLYYNASGATGGHVGSANTNLTALATFTFAGPTSNFTAADIRLTSTKIS